MAKAEKCYSNKFLQICNKNGNGLFSGTLE